MKTIQLLVLCAFLSILALPSQAQPTRKATIHKAESILEQRGEVAFTFELKSRDEIAKFTRMISIDRVDGKTVRAYANKKEFHRFLKTCRSFELLPVTTEEQNIPDKQEAGKAPNTIWNFYPTYTGYDSIMTAFQTAHPTLCRVFNIATLTSGRKLIVAKITGNVNVRGNKPLFLYTATMHGNEPTGYITMLHFIDYLLSNYGTDPRVTYLLDSIELYINPLANPDGCYAGGNNTVSGGTRYNENHVDLNRNYPDPQAGQHPDGNAWQPETQAFMHFADSLSFTMSANFHTGAEVFNYPWDTWAMLHADDNWYQRMGGMYADTVHANSTGNYFTDLYSGSHPGVTNGYAWYQVTGGRQDYMNYFKHCREVTIELSSTFIPSASTLPNYWNYNYRSLLNYMQQSLYGIRGIITDSCTGQAIQAKVFISTHDHDSSQVWSNLPIGDYHRPIYAGTYNVTYTAAGYVSKTINGVHVTNDSTTVVDVALAPIPANAQISATPLATCPGPVNFTSPSTRISDWHWNFGDGDSSTAQNPVHVYTQSGTYNVSLTVSNCASSHSQTLNNYITIYPVPAAPVISLLNDTLFSDAATGNQWYLNGTALSGATSNFYVPLQNGLYTVTAANSNGCVSDTSLALNYLSTGIRTLNSSAPAAVVYPNPASRQVMLKRTNGSGTCTVEFVNSLGATVMKREIGNGSTALDLESVSPGFYVLRFTENDRVSFNELVVE